MGKNYCLKFGLSWFALNEIIALLIHNARSHSDPHAGWMNAVLGVGFLIWGVGNWMLANR